MSDTEKSTGAGWSDKERFVYLFALMENTGMKLDFKSTPRPNGRSAIACERMIGRLKVTLAKELEALKNGEPITEATPKTPKTPKIPRTPKRKADKADGDAGVDGSPKKRGRKKKTETEAEAPVKMEDTNGIKDEVEDEV